MRWKIEKDHREYERFLLVGNTRYGYMGEAMEVIAIPKDVDVENPLEMAVLQNLELVC